VGYCNDNVQNRLDLIKHDYWLSTKSKDFALDFLKKQITDSEDYRIKCEKLNFKYIDFTNQKQGLSEMLLFFEETLTFNN
jgi:hypothetical protein